MENSTFFQGRHNERSLIVSSTFIWGIDHVSCLVRSPDMIPTCRMNESIGYTNNIYVDRI